VLAAALALGADEDFVVRALLRLCGLRNRVRVAAVDEAARRAFARYWLVVRPFSALIRSRWLRAAARAVA
jgi:hypothetical protein